MEENQCINCTVGSCLYNNNQIQKCTLKEIMVAPCSKCNNGKPEDESMCGSYESKFN